MVTFVTLFLTLVVGVHRVELHVEPAVASVELYLDGQLVGHRDEAPWRFSCDFGSELAPHRLVAIARDGNGRELERSSQLVNVQDSLVQMRLLREPDSAAGHQRVRVIWEAPSLGEPQKVTASLGGRPVHTSTFPQIDLGPRQRDSQVLSVHLHFAGGHSASADLLLGEEYGMQAETELTALRLAWRRETLPTADELARKLVLRNGGEVSVAAVERGVPRLLVVRERSEWNLDSLVNLSHIDQFLRLSQRLPALRDENASARFAFAQEPGRPSGSAAEIVPLSLEVELAGSQELFRLLTSRFFAEYDYPVPAQRLTDAVAVAGMVAGGWHQPLAILVLRTGESRDPSAHRIEDVLPYLERLAVPIRVWNPSTGPVPLRSPTWPDERNVGEPEPFNRALSELIETLNQQIVVWVRGSHLPGEVVLESSAPDLALPR